MEDEVAMTLNFSESSPKFSSSHLNAVTMKFPPQMERYGIRAWNTLTLRSLGSRTVRFIKKDGFQTQSITVQRKKSFC